MLNLSARFIPGHWRSPRPWYEVDPVSGCWLWARKVTSKGYGLVQYEGREVHAHRWFWIRERGPIPEGHEIHHRCGVRACVNLDHLEPVEASEHRRLHHRQRREGR